MRISATQYFDGRVTPPPHPRIHFPYLSSTLFCYGVLVTNKSRGQDSSRSIDRKSPCKFPLNKPPSPRISSPHFRGIIKKFWSPPSLLSPLSLSLLNIHNKIINDGLYTFGCSWGEWFGISSSSILSLSCTLVVLNYKFASLAREYSAGTLVPRALFPGFWPPKPWNSALGTRLFSGVIFSRF